MNASKKYSSLRLLISVALKCHTIFELTSSPKTNPCWKSYDVKIYYRNVNDYFKLNHIENDFFLKYEFYREKPYFVLIFVHN